jgi:hypothetical protein
MLRLRMTTRRMMVAVAIVAVLLGTGITWRRWRSFARQAEFHANQQVSYLMEASNSWQLATDEARSGREDGVRQFYGEAQDHFKRALHHGNMRKKYEQAMWAPWKQVPPDPPPP